MTIATIDMIVGILAGVKIFKLTDKKVKTSLTNDYFELRRYVKETEADRKELVAKFQSDWAEEMAEVAALGKEGKPVVGHDDYLEAEKDANEAISALFSREVEVDIQPIPIDDFIAACGPEELTLEQLAFLQESGIFE